jgi:hypothetical protein
VKTQGNHCACQTEISGLLKSWSDFLMHWAVITARYYLLMYGR